MRMRGSSVANDIPESVLDRAFHWAVVLGSGTAVRADHDALEHWLEQSEANRSAWRRVQAVEQEFSMARTGSRAASSALQRTARGRRMRSRAAVGSAIGVVLLLAGLLSLLLPASTGRYERQLVAVDQPRLIRLAGGTSLHLDAATTVSVSVQAGRPHLMLRDGRILVDSSAASVDRKPVIDAANTRFRALGTRFEISREKRSVGLSVLHGRVAIEADEAGGQQVAAAGERWRIRSGRIERLADDGLTPGAWVDGVIEADNARLGDVLDAIGRQRSGWLRYDATAAALRVTGVFHLSDTDAALRALEQSLPVRVDRMSGWWVTVHAK